MHKILKWVYIIFIHPNTITWFSAWMCFSMCFAYITMKWNAFCTNPDLRRFDLHVMGSCVNGIRNEFIWFWIVLSFIPHVWKIHADAKYYQKYIISAKFCTSNIRKTYIIFPIKRFLIYKQRCQCVYIYLSKSIWQNVSSIKTIYHVF